jgi:glycosyltransferase involved in cell wall biosynthesis
MMSVAISVVVPSRGGAQRLPLLLDLLAAQTQPDWEAVVVVDGDVDDSASVIEQYAAHAPVRSIVFPENRGRPAALNAGFEAASGEVLLRCDDDLAPRPDFLAGHVGAHADGPRGVIGMCRNLFPETAYAAAYGRRAYVRQRDAAYAAAAEDRWHYWGGNVSVDRATWHRVGPYDESFRSYGWEDVDWGYRLSRLGVPIVVVPALETDHHIAATTTAGRALRAYYSGSARHRFEAKHGTLAMAGGRSFDPWNLAVGTTARLMTEHRIGTAGRAVDRAVPRLPARIAEKAIALLVEAGAQAGYRRRDTSGSI